jgi:hypothetical protein
MSFADPELEQLDPPCPGCGSRAVFTAVALPGQREMPLYPACCHCGCEREDLADYCGDPPA